MFANVLGEVSGFLMNDSKTKKKSQKTHSDVLNTKS